jgi:hypothetical protein
MCEIPLPRIDNHDETWVCVINQFEYVFLLFNLREIIGSILFIEERESQRE